MKAFEEFEWRFTLLHQNGKSSRPGIDLVSILIQMEHDPDVEDLTETGPRHGRQGMGCRARSVGLGLV